MKNAYTLVIAALVGLALPLTASARTPARDEALRTAQYLVATLVDIEDLAEDLSYDASRYDDRHDAYAYEKLADSAAALQQKVQRQIVYPLHYGESFAYVKAQLSRIQSSFNLLKRDAREVYDLDYEIEELLETVDYLKYDLTATLQAGDRGRPVRPEDGRDQPDDAVVGR